MTGYPQRCLSFLLGHSRDLLLGALLLGDLLLRSGLHLLTLPFLVTGSLLDSLGGVLGLSAAAEGNMDLLLERLLPMACLGAPKFGWVLLVAHQLREAGGRLGLGVDGKIGFEAV
jgi:hypothetical protein